MATDNHTKRFALRPPAGPGLRSAVWWPHSRKLSDELSDLFALWPSGAGRIARVLYSPPDWDDHPRSVAVSGRWVKTGSFPRDDTRQIVLTMLGGRRLTVDVIAPGTPADEAAALLGETDGARSAWDDDGGHP
ncbi:MAG: DUF5994 family protein [Solirubrobacteraceae bacterium]